jgi:hypothetical protein
MRRALGERGEVREALDRKVRQQDEAQRAGQPGLAARFGAEAEELAARLLELEREIERLEAEEGLASA